MKCLEKEKMMKEGNIETKKKALCDDQHFKVTLFSFSTIFLSVYIDCAIVLFINF